MLEIEQGERGHWLSLRSAARRCARAAARAAATADHSCVRRDPISAHGRSPAIDVIREAAAAMAESWL